MTILFVEWWIGYCETKDKWRILFFNAKILFFCFVSDLREGILLLILSWMICSEVDASSVFWFLNIEYVCEFEMDSKVFKISVSCKLIGSTLMNFFVFWLLKI